MALNWDYIKRQKGNWYNNPEMAGHHWAADMLDTVNTIVKDPRLNKTKLQKYVIANSFRFDKDVNWHYFANHLTQKYVAHVKHMLKRLTKDNLLSELRWTEQRSGMIRSPLEKAMRVLAYKTNRNKYLDYASSGYKFYGMSTEDARKRAADVVKLMEKDLKIKLR